MNEPFDEPRRHGWLTSLVSPSVGARTHARARDTDRVDAGLCDRALATLRSDRAVEYQAIEEHFKYGSTGGERVSAFRIDFKAMPVVCSHHLPGGWASLGFVFEEGKDMVGMSMRNYQGIDRTFFNCAVCHTSTVRDTPEAKPRLVPVCRRIPSICSASRSSPSIARATRNSRPNTSSPRSVG